MVYPGSSHGAVRPARACECTVLSCTGVPVVGEYKRGERGREAPKSLLEEKMIEASVNIVLRRACVCCELRMLGRGEMAWEEARLPLL